MKHRKKNEITCYDQDEKEGQKIRIGRQMLNMYGHYRLEGLFYFIVAQRVNVPAERTCPTRNALQSLMHFLICLFWRKVHIVYLSHTRGSDPIPI